MKPPPLRPREGGGFEIDISRIDETSFDGCDPITMFKYDVVENLYKELNKELGITPNAIHTDLFELKGRKLYYRKKGEPLGELGE